MLKISRCPRCGEAIEVASSVEKLVEGEKLTCPECGGEIFIKKKGKMEGEAEKF